jgi:hypothetical protein
MIRGEMIVGRNDTGAELHGNQFFQQTLSLSPEQSTLVTPHIVRNEFRFFI